MRSNAWLIGLVSAAWLAGGCTRSAGGVGAGSDGGADDLGASPDGAQACLDVDQDGITTCDGDCDDNDPVQGSGEICGDGQDNDCGGDADEACNGLGTFVSGLTGLDSNPGTQAQPVKTIAQGIANAVAIGGAQTVIVAGTHYPEKVTLTEGKSLKGGHACNPSSCTWARDVKANDTAIDNQDFEGVLAGGTITRATRLEGFRIRGRAFTTGGGTAPPVTGSVCLSIDGGSPTVTGNLIEGAQVTGAGANGRSIGVAVYAPATDVLIDRNAITAGQGSGASIGILVTSLKMPMARAVVTITGNTIATGNSPSGSGISAFNTGAGTRVSGNVITAGDARNGVSWGMVVGSTAAIDGNRINTDRAKVGTCTAAGVPPWCGGIFSVSSTSTITNNVVFGTQGLRTCGVLLAEFEMAAGAVTLNGNLLDGGGATAPGSAPSQSAALVLSVGNCAQCGVNAFVGKVRNNILMGGDNINRFGVYEDPNQTMNAGRTIHPEALEHNDLAFTPAIGRTDVLYRQMAANNLPLYYTTLAAMEQGVPLKGGGNPQKNLAVDPGLDATWHLTPQSPCADQGTSTEAPAADIDGDARPKGAGIDIGADEAL